MNRSLAQVVSVLFHPLLLATYLFYIILYVMPTSVITFPTDKRWVIMAVIFFTTFVIPAVGTYFMFRNGYVSSMQVENRNERNLPFFFASVCYAVTTYMLYREAYIDRLLVYLMCLVTLSVFLTYLFSFLYKISAHSIGMGGVLGILLLLQAAFPDIYLLYVVLAFVILTGLVMSARLALDAHTPVEVYSGFMLGFSVSLGMWLAIS